MSPESDDWRLAVQHDYLKGLAWTWKSYRRPRPEWDHDHYWLTFAQSDIDAARLPQYLRLGCGVTAFASEDALSLIQQYILRGAEVPTVVSVVEDADVRTLDTGHVIPNLEEPVSRGIWYPIGFGFTRGPL